MRRCRRKQKKGYMFTMAALALLLGGMGTVYASWTDRLEARMDLNTGAFHMVVSGEYEPEAYLLDAEGEPVEECGAVLAAGKGENEAEFRIASGILMEMLSMGGSLRLEFPLECGTDGTVWETGISGQEEEIRLKPEQVLFLSGGELFLLPEHLAEPFEKPISCLVRTEATEGEQGTCGMITLSLKEEGEQVIESWPDVLTMTEEEWSQMVPEMLDEVELPEDLAVEDGEHIGTDTGVVVVYSMKCSLYLDQAGAVETAESGISLEPEHVWRNPEHEVSGQEVDELERDELEQEEDRMEQEGGAET